MGCPLMGGDELAICKHAFVSFLIIICYFALFCHLSYLHGFH
jgi:hypothetical protein